MGLLLALIIGAAVGGGAGYWLLENFDFLMMNILAGIIGSVLGAASYFFLINPGFNQSGWVFGLASALCSMIGALAFVFLLNGLHRLMPKRAAHQTNVDKDKIDED